MGASSDGRSAARAEAAALGVLWGCPLGRRAGAGQRRHWLFCRSAGIVARGRGIGQAGGLRKTVRLFLLLASSRGGGVARCHAGGNGVGAEARQERAVAPTSRL